MTTCTKKYTDIPFAHRQPNHDGHCALIHGHDWSFEFEFAAKDLDDCGFVVDFGKLKPLKALLDTLDHALVLNDTDQHLSFLKETLCRQSHDATHLARIVSVPDCSAEGLANWGLVHAAEIVEQMTNGRATVIRCTCFEDSKNSATATKEVGA